MSNKRKTADQTTKKVDQPTEDDSSSSSSSSTICRLTSNKKYKRALLARLASENTATAATFIDSKSVDGSADSAGFSMPNLRAVAEILQQRTTSESRHQLLQLERLVKSIETVFSDLLVNGNQCAATITEKPVTEEPLSDGWEPAYSDSDDGTSSPPTTRANVSVSTTTQETAESLATTPQIDTELSNDIDSKKEVTQLADNRTMDETLRRLLECVSVQFPFARTVAFHDPPVRQVIEPSPVE